MFLVLLNARHRVANERDDAFEGSVRQWTQDISLMPDTCLMQGLKETPSGNQSRLIRRQIKSARLILLGISAA